MPPDIIDIARFGVTQLIAVITNDVCNYMVRASQFDLFSILDRLAVAHTRARKKDKLKSTRAKPWIEHGV